MANNYQQAERQAAITRRIRDSRRKGDSCRCDVCYVNIGATQHEVFPKQLTREGTYERDLCLSRYVISLLCLQCHLSIQHSPEINRQLLAYNRYLWGEDIVNNHIRLMREAGINTSFQERT